MGPFPARTASAFKRDDLNGALLGLGEDADAILQQCGGREYMNDRGRWEFARVTWETFQAIARAK